MNDKEYWTNYYADNSKPTDASTFAEFILPYLDENKDLIELGCGNARDSIFFSKNNINVMAVDQVQSEIDFLNEHYKSDNIHFFCDDFTDLKNTEHDQIKENDFDYVYSRFTFHSINERKEDNALDWIKDNLKNDGLFLLEARSLNDPMFKQGEALSETENFTTHYRRYMDLDKITKKLEDRNFSIEYKIEDNNLAVHKDDNPYVIRIVAKKL
ncbi:class I SAM-dependent methyltransferase [Methanobrevibacter sp.]|uniref:class I SAM-dependent methyltransferase n=1 Tax=Methanobrevibacter sp. TaxID=66852 RepID=UPI002E787794|nr:class I SAM-dependent methyltransferase [Methanobrevibacter sp.]MEE1335182.1 class I SAM-dependent methyltransferase [Methanobrevibacter sp.]